MGEYSHPGWKLCSQCSQQINCLWFLQHSTALLEWGSSEWNSRGRPWWDGILSGTAANPAGEAENANSCWFCPISPLVFLFTQTRGAAAQTSPAVWELPGTRNKPQTCITVSVTTPLSCQLGEQLKHTERGIKIKVTFPFSLKKPLYLIKLWVTVWGFTWGIVWLSEGHAKHVWKSDTHTHKKPSYLRLMSAAPPGGEGGSAAGQEGKLEVLG